MECRKMFPFIQIVINNFNIKAKFKMYRSFRFTNAHEPKPRCTEFVNDRQELNILRVFTDGQGKMYMPPISTGKIKVYNQPCLPSVASGCARWISRQEAAGLSRVPGGNLSSTMTSDTLTMWDHIRSTNMCTPSCSVT